MKLTMQENDYYMKVWEKLQPYIEPEVEEFAGVSACSFYGKRDDQIWNDVVTRLYLKVAESMAARGHSILSREQMEPEEELKIRVSIRSKIDTGYNYSLEMAQLVGKLANDTIKKLNEAKREK